MDNRPIALIRNSNLYYIYTDNLQTPRAITDTANNMQWTWDNSEAFGNNLPTEVVSGFNFNLRFPGQYFDNETKLNYNIHRDYNPVWGRYMSSDPLGLASGINTYAYVGGNSLIAIDGKGLWAQYVLPPLIGATIGGGIGAWNNGLDGFKIGAIQGAITGATIVGAGKIVGGLLGEGLITQISANMIGAATGEIAGQKYNNSSCNIDWQMVGLATASGLIFSPVSKPYTLGSQTVTSWATKGIQPDLNSGRWVMTGYDNYRNYTLAGVTYAGKNNYITGNISGNNLSYPNGVEIIKGLWGQRIIK